MSLQIDIVKKLSSFTLEVALDAESETVGFLGESGCGKSMTMRCIAGIEKPDAGKIIVNGTTYFDSAAKINLKPQQRKTALLFQNYMLFPHMTVTDNIASGLPRKMNSDERKAIVKHELQRFGLIGFEKRYPLQLSGGQQQRVALARMLAARPGILMLDEPFSALDSHLKGVLEQNLTNLFNAFDGTIVYVSHDIDEAVRFCDRIAVMSDGHIMETTTPDRLINDPQSEAGLKISGCKNVTQVRFIDEHQVHAPKWGIDIQTNKTISPDVQYVGIRAFYLERVDGPGTNNFRVLVERTSDSRFDRMVTLRFLDRATSEEPDVAFDENEMKYLHQRLLWRVDKLIVPDKELPVEGEELWIHMPTEHLYFADR